MTTCSAAPPAGRKPTEEDVEPLSWAIWERARDARRGRLPAVQRRLAGALARTIVASLEPYDVVDHAGARAAPAADRRRSTRPRPGAVGALPPLGPLHAVHGDLNISGLPAISLPLYHGDDGLPLGVQLIGRPAARGGAARARRGARAGAPARSRAPAAPSARTPSTAAIGAGARRAARRRRVPVGARSSRPRSARPRPRSRTRVGPISSSSSAQRRATTGVGMRRSGRRRPNERSASRTICSCVSDLGPGELVAGAAGPLALAARQRRDHAVGDVRGPDRLERRAAAPGERHHAGQPARAARAASGRGRRGVDDRRREDRVLQRPHSRTACSASAFARISRERLWVRRAERAEEDEALARPRARAASTRRQVATPASSSIEPRLVADRRREVHDRVDAAQRVAEREAGRRGRRGRSGRARDRRRAAAGRGRGSGPACPAAVSRRSSGRPTVPVAPVRSSTGGRLSPP